MQGREKQILGKLLATIKTGLVFKACFDIIFSKRTVPLSRKLGLPLMAATIALSGSIGLLFPANSSAYTIPSTQEECRAAGGQWQNTAAAGAVPVLRCNASKWSLMTPSEQALSWSYYETLRSCIRNHMYGDINITASANGAAPPTKWFDDFSSWGYIRPEGKADCKDIATKALSFWQVTDRDMLTAMGYSLQVDYPRWHGSSDSTAREDAFKSAYKALVDSGLDGRFGMPAYAEYGLYLDTFKTTCKASNLGLYSELTNRTYKSWVDDNALKDAEEGHTYIRSDINDSYYPSTQYTATEFYREGYTKIKLYSPDNPESNTPEYAYKYLSGYALNNQDHGAVLYGYRGDLVKKSCKEIAAALSDLATAYAKWARDNPTKVAQDYIPDTTDSCPPGEVCDGEEEPSCGIEGVGWIVCPVLTFLGGVTDDAFNFLSSSFLQINSSLVSTGGGTYSAWSTVRNLANVLFVIVFLIIIFSQLTGVGITNYGVKKMLPRLVISAILVNVSFFLCQIAVDLSNILGRGTFDFFKLLPISAGDATGLSVDVGGGLLWGTLLTGGAILAGVSLLLAVTVPVLIAALLAVLTIVLILVLRMAIVVIFTVIAPLAFVAFLLPNTESLFKKWYTAFGSVLLVYPIIGLVFGASTTAATIISNAGLAAGDNLLQVVSLGVATLPLITVPFILKGSLNGIGTLGAKLSGLASKAGGNVGKAVKDTSRLAAYNEARKRNSQIRRAQITGGVYKGRNPFSRLSSGVSGALNSSGITGATGNRVAQQAAKLANTLDVENVEASKAQIEQAVIADADLERIASGGKARGMNGADAHMRAAAMETLAARGSYGELERSWDSLVSSGDAAAKRAVSSTMARSQHKPVFIGAGALQTLAEADPAKSAALTLRTLAVDGTTAGAYSPAKLAATGQDELRYVFEEAFGSSAPPVLKDAANTALSNPEINQHISKNREIIEDIYTSP